MLLSLKERLVTQGLYPQNSNFATQLLVEDIDEKIKLTKVERKLAVDNSDPKTGFVDWEKVGKKEKKIDFSGAEVRFLKERVDALDKEEKINQQILSLCKKIKDAKGKDESNS